jgi:WD repeat-containing protein 61
LENGTIEKTIDAGPGNLWNVAFSPDEKTLVSGSQQGKINIFDVESGKIVKEITTPAKFIQSISYVSDRAFGAQKNIYRLM